MKNDVISPEFDENGRPLRRIRSFVRRQGRLTKGQQHALDNIWPVMGVEFNDAPLDFAALFGRDAPVTLEIGFGMGASLVAMAKAKPEQNFLGIEVHSPGVWRLSGFCGRRRRTKPARNVSRCGGSAAYHDPG
ncbi:tRNA (guanine46-N7-)-methyltransferase [Klebsiella pneumoniae subsp. ozaenae]|uniref:tRNA (guanine(46)-N(7))-methyltransferase n=1 Tax=Klebsiella pneumoniae subsp. ozaenae TaxID=574 RepID=A0A377Z6J0_KLEPO|nr:tRNA (guanine46-N7-)-methyltransferase [Klebsiella pneumoniae subsp. ozaenae]